MPARRHRRIVQPNEPCLRKTGGRGLSQEDSSALHSKAISSFGGPPVSTAARVPNCPSSSKPDISRPQHRPGRVCRRPLSASSRRLSRREAGPGVEAGIEAGCGLLRSTSWSAGRLPVATKYTTCALRTAYGKPDKELSSVGARAGGLRGGWVQGAGGAGCERPSHEATKAPRFGRAHHCGWNLPHMCSLFHREFATHGPSD